MDQDFTKNHSLFVRMPQHQNMFSQEFTFRSKNDHWYHWMTGVFAFTQTKNFATAINYFTPKHALRAKGMKDNENEIPVSGLAAYHVSSFDLYKGLSASLGIRYDYETSKVDNHTYWTQKIILQANQSYWFSTMKRCIPIKLPHDLRLNNNLHPIEWFISQLPEDTNQEDLMQRKRVKPIARMRLNTLGTMKLVRNSIY